MVHSLCVPAPHMPNPRATSVHSSGDMASVRFTHRSTELAQVRLSFDTHATFLSKFHLIGPQLLTKITLSFYTHVDTWLSALSHYTVQTAV